MKHLRFFSGIVGLLLFLSCSSNQKAVETSKTIKPQKVMLEITATHLPKQVAFVSDDNKHTYPIHRINDGYFTGTLDIPAGFYKINIGREYSNIYLKPGMKLKISVDGNQFDESIHYEGTGKKINNFLAREMLHEEETRKKQAKAQFVNLSEQDFLKYTDSIYNQNMNRLKQSGIKDHDFIYLQSKKYQIDKNILTSLYPQFKSYILKKPYKTAPGYPKPLDGLDINDHRLLQLPGYLSLIETSLEAEADPKILHEDYDLALLKAAEKKLQSNENLKEVAMNYLAKSGMQETKNLPEYYNILKRNIKNSKYLTQLEKLYKNLLKTQPGNPSPDFTAYDINDKAYHLADFKGKNIYIDLWATWCAPCRAEIPHLELLKKEYEGKNIVFLSIDVFDRKEKWENMVAKNIVTGRQLIMENNDNEFIKTYNVRSIPRFILLDTEGKIIKANAPRPSDKRLVSLLDKILQ